ncbi:MAG: hypothetical protein AAGC45_02760 [Bacteroidota bacterium]
MKSCLLSVSSTALSDVFIDGNENFTEFENEDLVAGTTININVYGISERYHGHGYLT